MKSLNIVAVNGSLSFPSRTRVLVDTVLDRLSSRVPVSSRHVIDLAELGPALAGSLDFRNLPLTVAAAIDRIEQADVLIAASPIYRGAYTGLFKHLFDLVGQDALIGKPVLLAATGGSERHSLALDHVFRPLFGFFRSHTVPSGVYASSADFADQTIINPATRARIDEAVGQVVTLVRGTHGLHVDVGVASALQQARIGAYAAGA